MKFLLMFMFLTGMIFAQSSVRTSINYQERQIFNEKLSGVEYSTAVSLAGREGILTLGIESDTTALTGGAARSDSCLTIGFQIYIDNIGWSTYYNDRTTHKGVTFTKIDTIDRALCAGENLVMNFATATTADCLGDSLRFVQFIGTGDSTNLIIELRQE